MANIPLKYAETNLVGTIVNTAMTATSLTVYAEFIDSKTGIARAPHPSTNSFTIEKDNENFEMILADSHSTTNGVTTIIVNSAGRNLNKHEEGIGSGTGLAHPIGAEIGCADIQTYFGTLNKIIDGTNDTMGENFRIGNSLSNDITLYASIGSINNPFFRYSIVDGKWLLSNNGVDTYDIVAGGGGLTAGDGIDIAAGVINVDIKADSGLQFTATELDLKLRPDYGLVADSNGLYIDLATDSGLQFTGGKLELSLAPGGGLSKDATGISTTANLFEGIAGEAINGSSTPKAVVVGGSNFKYIIRMETGTDQLNWFSGGADENMGNIDSRTRIAQSFTVNASGAGTVTIDRIVLMVGKVGSPTDNTFIEIHGDAGNKPDNISLGASNNVAGSGLSTGSQYKANTYNFSSPVTITGGTKYWIVWRRSGANDAVNYYRWKGQGSNIYSNHGNSLYTASTVTWTAENPFDYYFYLRANIDYDGRIYNGSTNYLELCKFVGFTTSNVSAGQTLNIQSNDVITYPGLTKGETYYLSSASGSITLTPTVTSDNCMVPVGEAVDDDQLLINRCQRSAYHFLKNIWLQTANDTLQVDLFIPTGFKPETVSLRVQWQTSAGDTTAGMYDYLYLTPVQGMQAHDLNALQTINAQTYIVSHGTSIVGAAGSGIGPDSSKYVAVVAIYQNGFDLRISCNNSNYYPSFIETIARGY